MRRVRLRTLLWAVLVSNLVTHALLLGAVVAAGALYLGSIGDGSEGGGNVGYDLEEPPPPPADPPEGEPAPAGAAPDLRRLRLSDSEWKTLLSGEALRQSGRGAGLVQVRARFLVRAEPAAIYDVLADPEALVEIYDDLEKAEVRQSVDAEGERYDVVWFLGQSGIYDLEYTLRRDYVRPSSIRWTLVKGPGTSRLLSACQGAWYLTETGVPALTLVEYRNQVDITGLPDVLLQSLVDNNLPHVMKVLRGRVESR